MFGERLKFARKEKIEESRQQFPIFLSSSNQSTIERMIRAYSEFVNFIASGTTPQAVVAFSASEETKQRVAELITREKSASLTVDERAELDHFMEVEHIVRLAKAKARKLVTG